MMNNINLLYDDIIIYILQLYVKNKENFKFITELSKFCNDYEIIMNSNFHPNWICKDCYGGLVISTH